MRTYTKSGIWYAPNWTAPDGSVVKAHSLGTRDRDEAENTWILERAQAIAIARGLPGAQLALPAGVRVAAPAVDETRLSEALADYLIRKAGSVEPITLDGYWRQAAQILCTLEDHALTALAGDGGTRILDEWATDEVERLAGRTHSVVKKLAAIIKPALVLAHHKGALARMPLFPQLRNDYYEVGRRTFAFTPEQYASFRVELAEECVAKTPSGARLVVYPRLWADIAVSTGMHDSDINRFAVTDYDAARGIWFRRNKKGARHYPAEWFPADAYLARVLDQAAAARGGAGLTGPWVTGGAAWPARWPWMRYRLIEAARRARLSMPEGEELSTLAFRHTFATWRCAEGWSFDETARVLGNSSEMVRQVYARTPKVRFQALVDQSSPQAAQLMSLTAALDRPRKGPHRRGRPTVVRTVVNPQIRRRLTP